MKNESSGEILNKIIKAYNRLRLINPKDPFLRIARIVESEGESPALDITKDFIYNFGDPILDKNAYEKYLNALEKRLKSLGL